MTRRQITPDRWLVVTHDEAALWNSIKSLPRGGGIILLAKLDPRQLRRLRRVARTRGLVVVEHPECAARVHNLRELTRARLFRNPKILISPLYPTTSHPDWRPLPRMRAATLARLANRQAIALGGMNAQRHSTVAPLGFAGWAGISAFRT